MQRAEQELANKRKPNPYQIPKVGSKVSPHSNASSYAGEGAKQSVEKAGNGAIRITPSVVNLTKPELYSIYAGDSNVEGDDDEDESQNIYNNLSEGLHRSTSHHIEERKSKHHKKQNSSFTLSLSLVIAKVITCSLLLSITGNLMFYFGEQLYKANPILPDISKYRFLYIFQDLLRKNEKFSDLEITLLGNGAESVIVGFASFILGKAIDLFVSGQNADLHSKHGKLNKLKEHDSKSSSGQGISTNNEDYEENSSDESESFSLGFQIQHYLTLVFDSNLVRSMVAAVGLAYCFKKYQWSSKIQVVSLWSAANIIIWRGTDANITGLISSTIIAFSVMAFNAYYDDGITFSLEDTDSIADILWVGSFVFIGQIIFSKIIRLVFNS